ncbi:Polysaccharide biosynthesis protein [compost metagenome]
MFLISILILITDKNDYYLVPLLNGMSMLISTVAAVWIIHHRFAVRFRLATFSGITRVIIDGRHAFISQLAPTLYNNSSTFVLGIVAPHNIVGIFSAATKLIDVANSVAYLLTNTFLPYLTRNFQNFTRFSTLMITIGSLLTIFIMVFSPTLTEILFSTDSIAITEYTRVLAPSIFFTFISLTFGTTYLIASNTDKKLSKITALTSLFFGISGSISTILFGVWGAIFTIVICRLSLALLFISNYLTIKQANLRESKKTLTDTL